MAAFLQAIVLAEEKEPVGISLSDAFTLAVDPPPWPKNRHWVVEVPLCMLLRIDDDETHTFRLWWEDPTGRELNEEEWTDSRPPGTQGHMREFWAMALRIPVYEEGIFKLWLDIDGFTAGYAPLLLDPDRAYRLGALRPILNPVG
jgi:hypothetical protein